MRWGRSAIKIVTRDGEIDLSILRWDERSTLVRVEVLGRTGPHDVTVEIPARFGSASTLHHLSRHLFTLANKL